MYPEQDAKKAALGRAGGPNSAPCLHLLDTSQRAPNMTLGIRKLRLVFPSARLQTSLSCPDPWKVTLWLFTAKVKIPGRRDFD